MSTLQDLPDLNLAAMQDEVVANNVAKGWREQPCPWPTAMALLHEEAAEAGAAWRRWGLDDATDKHGCDDPQHGDSTWEHECWTAKPPKPEGVGSELADLVIRLLDDCDQYEVPVAELTAYAGRFGINADFMASINVLHMLIARASHAFDLGWDADQFHTVGRSFASIYVYVCQLAAHCGIDLQAEYARKHAFNTTREYRHGGKRC